MSLLRFLEIAIKKSQVFLCLGSPLTWMNGDFFGALAEKRQWAICDLFVKILQVGQRLSSRMVLQTMSGSGATKHWLQELIVIGVRIQADSDLHLQTVVCKATTMPLEVSKNSLRMGFYFIMQVVGKISVSVFQREGVAVGCS